MQQVVIGGGIYGLTKAYLLCKQGKEVILFEKTDRLGGLARTTEIDGKRIEVYYHHYDAGDKYLFHLCKELGIEIEWFHAKCGLITNTWNPYKIYKNLIYQKFGHTNISLRWALSRPKFCGKLAYIKGSTQVLIDRLESEIKRMGGKIRLDTEVPIEPPKDMLGICCALLLLDRPLTKYYWLPVADLSFTFGLVVERNVVYLTKYDMNAEIHCTQLRRINPHFNIDWVRKVITFRDKFAQEKFPTKETRGLDEAIKRAYVDTDTNVNLL